MKQYVVDAFAEKVFEGNPAAICVMDRWPADSLMQKIAVENNLSETAFAVKEGDVYHLRWFTPGGEIDLCGHATLAAAFVITRFIEKRIDTVRFSTLSGILTVSKKGGLYEMDFPAYPLSEVPVTGEMAEAIGLRPTEAYMGRDLLCVFESEKEVLDLHPDQARLLGLDGLLLHATAKGTEYDCVSRSFCPKCGIAEDPVCGSGHCHIVPYWAGKLGKNKIVARQASLRGGTLYCEYSGDRVTLSGHAVLYSTAEINIE